MECGWFAPQHKTWSKAYTEMGGAFEPIIDGGSKGGAVMRCSTRGRLDFWTLDNQMAGRSRRYQRIVIDEAAFGKDGGNTSDGSLMDLWEKSIKPTLFDFRGEALVCSNSAGKKPVIFLLQNLHGPAVRLQGIPRAHGRQRPAAEAHAGRNSDAVEDQPRRLSRRTEGEERSAALRPGIRGRVRRLGRQGILIPRSGSSTTRAPAKPLRSSSATRCSP